MAGNSPFFEGFLDDYYAESGEHLDGARQALLALERALGDRDAERTAIDDLFRFFHSLKAISGMVELHEAEQLSHELENYLRAIRQREIAVSVPGIEVLIAGTKRLDEITAARRANAPLPPIDDLVKRVAALLPQQPAAARPLPVDQTWAVPGDQRTWVCTFTPTREHLADGMGVDGIRKRLAALGRIVNAVPRVGAEGSVQFEFTVAVRSDIDLALALKELPLAVAEASTDVAAAAPAAAAPVSTPSQVVRVDLGRLDELMQAVGNLVITRARLADSLSRAERHVPSAEWRSVQENAQLLDRQLRTLREGIMRVRLVQIGEIFRRMPFVVRDLARETNKKVALHLEGQTTEIDKFLIERIADPIVHLVRNAVSHGIETPDARIAAGKAPDGTLTLRASTSGDIVRIEIADDGRGIDGGRIFERAHALGLSTTGDPSDPAAVLAVICAPGFSTRDAADRASGRGVGMAVVKNTIEQLSGTLSLDTAPGEGTRFIIQLPLTLAITDALIGRVGTEAFAIPQSAVREVLEVSRSQLRAIEGNELVPYRDSSLPVVHIAKVFGIATTPSDRFHVFVVGSGTSALGFAVDRIVGQREVVVRAIADPLVRVDGVAGATDLGDGRVVLILDPATLSRGRQRSVTG